MENSRYPDSLKQCRLCGIAGHHRIDIFDPNSRPGPSYARALGDEVFRFVEVRVERDDETTKMCGTCFNEIRHFVRFRDACIATNRGMQQSLRRRIETSGDVINEFSQAGRGNIDTATHSGRTFVQNHYPSISVESISLNNDETESENDDIGILREIITETPNVHVSTLNGRREGAVQQADIVSGGSELIRLKKREPECNAHTTLEHPSSDSIALYYDGALETSNDGAPRVNKKTADSAFCDVDLDSIIDKTDSEIVIVAPLAQTLRRRQRNGKSSGESKRVENKNVSENLVECRSRGGCKESFGSWDAMMFHVTNYHAKGVKRTFCCHLCKKTICRKQMLQLHMNSVHDREIRFICPIRRCAKIFTLKGNLVQHTNAVHTKRVAFKCTKCPMKFYWKKLLTRHLANKHGVGMTFSCYLCKKASSRKQVLQMHMNSLHTGQVRFTCPFPMCSKSFTRKSNLNKHTNAIHTKKNVFKCTECDKKFYYKQSLNQHIANKH